VKFHDNRRPHKRPPVRRPTPEQMAAAHEEALKWRDRWRAEMAAPPQTKPKHAANGIARFAKALARAEFGRFYWSDALTRQLTNGLRKAKRKRE
jgi:hypothetical protein